MGQSRGGFRLDGFAGRMGEELQLMTPSGSIANHRGQRVCVGIGNNGRNAAAQQQGFLGNRESLAENLFHLRMFPRGGLDITLAERLPPLQLPLQ